MSNSRKINQLADKRRAATKAKKRQAEVEEYEEVEIVDRRGNVRIDLQRVHQQAQPNPTTPSRSKRARQKSPSPIASGSKQSSRKPRTTKSQNDYLREWLLKRETFLHLLLEQEGPDGNGTCDECSTNDGVFRCLDCFGNLTHCHKCFLHRHKLLPFHRIQKWNGKYFVKTSLFKQGYVLHLGHKGKPCPSNLGTSEAWEDVDEERMDFSGVDLLHANLEQITTDSYEGRVVDIVHTTGIFRNYVKWCACQGAAEKDVQLFQTQLFPASHQRPETAFTFDVLNYFYIDSMECKTSAASFYKKLCRLTNNAFPHTVTDRVRELRRVSRAWRDLQCRKRFGFGHDTNRTPQNGDLAYFCPACPQPNINLPADWKNSIEPWLLRRSIVADGNFHADHMKMRNPEDDVDLADGLGFMAESGPYQDHIKESKEQKQRSTCRNHRAMNAANLNRKNRDATGIGACACARHGCFVPHSVVDFQKGERQMNMDYAICNALKYNSHGLLQALVIYDIGCQWIINFLKRLKESSYLSFSDVMTLLVAVGKFHLSAHVQECFVEYSLNFLYGAGQLDGEILETLWTPFNPISKFARSASMASRRQLYDDHMRDSNWKKIVGIGMDLIHLPNIIADGDTLAWPVFTLRRKMERAKEGVRETSDAFQKLSATMKKESLEAWQKAAEKANMERGANLKIYDINLAQAPTQADIRLMLTGEERKKGLKNGTITWLTMGISLEDYQDTIRSDVRKMRKQGTVVQWTSIEDKRRRLETRLHNFQKKAEEYMGDVEEEDDVDMLPQFTGFEVGDADDSDDEFEDEEDVGGEDSSDDEQSEFPENAAICMPSSFNMGDIEELGIADLAAQEMELRKGQANDCLKDLRLALGHKAVLWRTQVRGAKTTLWKTRAWDDIKAVTVKVNKHVRAYRRARTALERLGADEDTMERYQELQREDLRLSGDITEENRLGQRSDTLPWFWRIDGKDAEHDDVWMQEFYRVNWLRAKARSDRWREELITVKNEMQWTVLWFEEKVSKWMERAERSEAEGKLGHRAYAEKQAAMWKLFVEQANQGFRGMMING